MVVRVILAVLFVCIGFSLLGKASHDVQAQSLFSGMEVPVLASLGSLLFIVQMGIAILVLYGLSYLIFSEVFWFTVFVALFLVAAHLAWGLAVAAMEDVRRVFLDFSAALPFTFDDYLVGALFFLSLAFLVLLYFTIVETLNWWHFRKQQKIQQERPAPLQAPSFKPSVCTTKNKASQERFEAQPKVSLPAQVEEPKVQVDEEPVVDELFRLVRGE